MNHIRFFRLCCLIALAAFHYGCRVADNGIGYIDFLPSQVVSIRVDDARMGEPIVGAEVTFHRLYTDDPEADVDYSKYADIPGGFTDTTDADGLATPRFVFLTGCSGSWAEIRDCDPGLIDRVTGQPYVVIIVMDGVESYMHGLLSPGDSLENDTFVVTVIEVGESTL
jgi:hypothetical protein